MDEQKHTTESWEQHSYGTGSTQPPKSHGGLIAVLLVLVILLGGISSALGILNIRLFSMLESQMNQENNPHFNAVGQPGTFPTDAQEATIPAAVLDTLRSQLGISGEEVSGFYQHYYRLPAGVLVAQVLTETDADLQAGDILVNINDIRVKSPQEAATVLEALPAGQPVSLVLFRTGREVTVSFTPISQQGD